MRWLTVTLCASATKQQNTQMHALLPIRPFAFSAFVAQRCPYANCTGLFDSTKYQSIIIQKSNIINDGMTNSFSKYE